MADDVLRLRATIVNEEFLANIRVMGRELGLLQQKGGKGAQEAARGWALLGKQVKGVVGEISAAVPALGGFGLGAAGAGIAARVLVGTLGDISKKIVEMKYASKELGLSQEALKAFSTEAQKAGIAPQALLQGLGNFKRNTEDFSNRIGELRGQLVAMGAGPVLARINSATNQMDKLQAAFDFKEVLMKSDPEGVKARRFFEMIGLGADTARLSWEQFLKTKEGKKALTPEEVKAAEDFNAALIAMGDQWDELSTKVGIKLFPEITKMMNEVLVLIDKLEAMSAGGEKGKKAANDVLGAQPFGKSFDFLNMTPSEAWGKLTEKPDQSLASKWWGQLFGGSGGPGRAAGGPVQRGIRYTVGEKGPEQFTPSMSGMISPAGGDEANQSRIIKIGVFEALVDFKSYMEGSAAAGGPGGANIIKASLGGGGGFTGGSTGSGGYTGDGGSTGSGGGSPSGSSIPRPEGGSGGTPGVGAARGTVAKGGDPRGMEAHIRETAAKYGIDPDTAVAVAKSEGLSTFQSSVKRSGKGSYNGREDSWGAFQMYMGGGLGNAFQKETGLDPRDPANEKATIDYALKHASKHGWGSWHGAKNTGIGPMAGIGGNRGVGAARGKVASLEPGVQPDGQATPVPASPGGGAVEEAQERVAGIRKGKLDAQLREALEYSAEASGLKVRVTSGGQRMHGAHGATGSHRHDKGRAADIDLIDPKTGKILDRSDPRRLKFLEESAAAGAGGTGAGYMSDRRKIHVGTTGSQAIVGKGLGAYAGSPEERAAVGRGLDRMMTPAQVAEARQRQIAARDATKRIDTAVAPQNPSGSVNVTVNSNGTKAEADAKTNGDLFQPPTVRQHKQMQRTEDAGESMSI